MMMHQTLTQLRTLKLDGFADGLEEQLTQPGTAALSFEERLSLLVDREASWRDDRRRTRLLKQARLKYPQAAMKISTPALVEAWTHVRSRAWLSVTGSSRDTACSLAAQPVPVSHGSLVPSRSMPADEGTPRCTCACLVSARNCASSTATAASPNGCCRSLALMFSCWTIGEWLPSTRWFATICSR